MTLPKRNSIACTHCKTRPADRYLYTILMHTGGYGDAVKRTSYLCEGCANEAEKWLEEIGLVLMHNVEDCDWDALIEMLPSPTTERQ